MNDVMSARRGGHDTACGEPAPLAVSLHGVTKDFGAVRAVNDLTLRIPKGRTVALLGPNGPSPLTERERDVLSAAADGSTVADVAARLHLSESTVRNYLSSAIGKTGTRNRIEAARTARHNGWL